MARACGPGSGTSPGSRGGGPGATRSRSPSAASRSLSRRAATVMSGTTAANPPYALPLGFFQQQAGGGAGKSLLIKGGGWWSTATAARTTNFQVGLNSTAGTGAIALPFGKTGTLTTVVTTL